MNKKSTSRTKSKFQTQFGRKLELLGYWLKAFGPIGLAFTIGATWFRKAVVSSIESTPHPVLVYTIFVVLGIGVVVTAHALMTFVYEEDKIVMWRKCQTVESRMAFRERLGDKSALVPIFKLLTGDQPLPLRMRQAAVEQELDSMEHSFTDMIALPNYIGGALVGIGLVGTFVGLLGTLDDLGKLFASLGTAGSSSADPGALFGDMVRRLQEPMRGMGTAFVASLYGLLGSLLLGLTSLSVRETGLKVVEKMREAIRQDGYGSILQTAPLLADVESAWLESDRWSAMFNEMREQNMDLQSQLNAVIKLFMKGQEEMQQLTASNLRLAESLEQRNDIDMIIKRVLGEGLHWAEALDYGANFDVARRNRLFDNPSRGQCAFIGKYGASNQRQHPTLHDATLQALSNQSQKISRMVEAVESQDRSTSTYNQALMASLQSHQNSVSQSTDSLRALVAKLIDRDNAK
jgi:hypothetical protein